MKAICGRHADETAEFAKRFGWESHESDWQKLCERKDIDVVDIATPGGLHHDMAVAAAKAGKHVFCEKPLAFNLKDAREMLDAARKAGVVHMVNFNYRVVPALALAKQMIAAGEIGEVRHFRATYLQDWLNDPKFPMNWRLRKDAAGSGANGDLNAHHVDMARFLVGDIGEVVGMKKTFITERPAEGRSAGLTATAGEGTEKVTVDDATLFLAKFNSGALGSFEATRMAPGRKNYNRVEINGSRGSLVFNFEEMNVLQFYNCADPPGRQGFRQIMATEGVHPYVAALVAAGPRAGLRAHVRARGVRADGRDQQEANDHGRLPRRGPMRGRAGCGREIDRRREVGEGGSSGVSGQRSGIDICQFLAIQCVRG